MRANFDINTLPSSMSYRLKKKGNWFNLIDYYHPQSSTALTTFQQQQNRSCTIDTLYVDGLTFFQACHKGAVTVAMTFLLGGIDPNVLDVEGSGFSALHYAVAQDDVNMIALLTDAGASINLKSKGNGMTPLMVAFDVGALECLNLLFDRGANFNDTDATGEPAIFYAANQPLVLNWLKKNRPQLVSDLRKFVNDKGETLLHRAVGKRDTQERWDVFYLIEEGGIDVDCVDANGETPLYNAIRAHEYQNVAALIQKGANLRTHVNREGESPLQLPCKSQKIQKLLSACNRASNNATIEKLVAEDYSNLPLLLNKDSFMHVAVPFFVPNTLLVIGSYLPTILGVLTLAGTGYGFTQVAGFALKRKGRSLPTAGWFLGALCYGSVVLIRNVFPVFQRHDPATAFFLIPLWYVATAIMLACYITAVLRDPGVVRSTVEQRRDIYQLIAEKGKIAIEIENIDMTSMVKKPFRSKHCTKTHRTVARFDHYCVWTGNAIGGGNHRAFAFYCCFEIVSQLIVLYTTFAVVFKYGPIEAGVISLTSSLSVLLDWLFSYDIAIVTYFLVIYNTALLLFVFMVMMGQIWYATRNVTSNEVWNAPRYKWMFMLGSRAYSFYDKGIIRNLGEFLCFGDLLEVSYTLPKMNEHLRQLSKSYAHKIKAQAGIKDEVKNDDVPMEIVSSPSSSSSSRTQQYVQEQQQQQNQPVVESPSAALSNALAAAPTEVRTQMMVVQKMLGQMIQGKDEPDFPEGVSLTLEERSKIMQQVKAMHAQYNSIQARMQQVQQSQLVPSAEAVGHQQQ